MLGVQIWEQMVTPKADEATSCLDVHVVLPLPEFLATWRAVGKNKLEPCGQGLRTLRMANTTA